jgi:hypothetical protein
MSKDAVIAVFKVQMAPIVAFPLIGWALEGRTDLGDLVVHPILGPSILRLVESDLTFPMHLRGAIVLQMEELLKTQPGASLVTMLLSKTDVTSNDGLAMMLKIRRCGFMGKDFVD